MSDPTPAGRGVVRLNVALCAVVALLVALLVYVLVRGSAALPWTTSAEATQNGYDDVKAAASSEVTAFLRVDYRHMDPLINDVLDGATGTFRRQYGASRANLKSAAGSAHAVSTGSVKQVGITAMNSQSATVLVAADAVVRNKQTGKVKATKACPHAGAVCRFYRLKLGMRLTTDGWKMATLDFAS